VAGADGLRRPPSSAGGAEAQRLALPGMDPARLLARRTRGRLFLLAAILAVVGAGLLVVAGLEPTWTFSAQGSPGSSPAELTIAFLPGSSFLETCGARCLSPGSSISIPYAASGLNGTGELYGAYQVIWPALGALALLNALVVGMAARRSRRQQYHHGKLVWGMRLAGAAPLLALALLLAIQPGIIGADPGAATGLHWAGVSPSPSQSFVGSCAATSAGPDGSCPAGETESWGPGIGFYLALLAGLLLLAGSALLGLARRALRDAQRPEAAGVSPTGGTPGSRVPAPATVDLATLLPPPPGLVQAPGGTLPPGLCPRCGAFTPAPATYCRTCGNVLPPTP
jgi:hypothetical protein